MGFKNHFLVDSCTRALEIAAHCLGLQKDDEVIVPAYSYVSTANVFAKYTCQLKFADSQESHPNISASTVEPLITQKTKAVVAIHYGGYSNEIAELRLLCDKHGIILIEDNAHGIGAKSGADYLGTFGHFAAISFHQSKNIHSFTGGLLAVNDMRFLPAATEYFYKGTNRAAFQRGDLPFYEWTSLGNSCEMNPMAVAFLAQQIGLLQQINEQRLKIWNSYQQAFEGCVWNFVADGIAQKHTQSSLLNDSSITVKESGKMQHNAHIYPLCFPDENARLQIEKTLKEQQIAGYTHYHSMHKTRFGKQFGDFQTPNADKFTRGLLRLPIYPGLAYDRVIEAVFDVYNNL